MDNIGNSGFGPDKDIDKPIPFDDGTSGANVSHSPLNLGGGDSTPAAPKIKVTSGAVKPAEAASSAERITGMRTFFTKLHSGAIDFLDGQITKWLHDNPGVTIKRTNTVVGDIRSKKTEPNIIITIWY